MLIVRIQRLMVAKVRSTNLQHRCTDIRTNGNSFQFSHQTQHVRTTRRTIRRQPISKVIRHHMFFRASTNSRAIQVGAQFTSRHRRFTNHQVRHGRQTATVARNILDNFLGFSIRTRRSIFTECQINIFRRPGCTTLHINFSFFMTSIAIRLQLMRFLSTNLTSKLNTTVFSTIRRLKFFLISTPSMTSQVHRIHTRQMVPRRLQLGVSSQRTGLVSH